MPSTSKPPFTPLRTYPPDNAIAIEVDIINHLAYPERLDDPTLAQVEVYFPDGTTAVAFGDGTMDKVTDRPDQPKGVYRYIYVANAQAPIGLYTYRVRSTAGTYVSTSERFDGFVIAP